MMWSRRTGGTILVYRFANLEGVTGG